MNASVTSLHRGPVLLVSNHSPTERLRIAYRIAEQSAAELHDGTPGSGVKLMLMGASVHLACEIGPEDAGAYFDQMAARARSVGSPTEAA